MIATSYQSPDLLQLIKNWSLFQKVSGVSFLVPDGIWLGAFVKKYVQGVLILASVLFVLYREALVVERLRRLPRMQEVVGSNPTEGKIPFSQFTLFNRVECEKLFCKTNLKLKVLKINKNKIIKNCSSTREITLVVFRSWDTPPRITST